MEKKLSKTISGQFIKSIFIKKLRKVEKNNLIKMAKTRKEPQITLKHGLRRKQ